MSGVLEILESVGAILRHDHFILTSGRHSDTYINKDALYPHTKQTSQVCEMLAEMCQDLEVEVVVAPALGGIILSQWTASHLSQLKGKEVLAVYAEKTPDKNFQFTRGYDQLLKGKKILVVEDLTSTGGSAKKVAVAVAAVGGKVQAIAVMMNRDPALVNTRTMGVEFRALGELTIQTFAEDEVPGWLAERPINMRVGHGKKYLEHKKS
jgi:orotate phosphoribosyltransferase